MTKQHFQKLEQMLKEKRITSAIKEDVNQTINDVKSLTHTLFLGTTELGEGGSVIIYATGALFATGYGIYKGVEYLIKWTKQNKSPKILWEK